MSMLSITRKNKEFAKWWGRWASRLKRNHSMKGGAVAAQNDQKVADLPYALEILRRFPKNDL